MNELLNQIWQSVSQYIDIAYLVTFMMFSYLIKKNFQDLLDKITGMKWKPVYTVLIIAAIVALPFYFFKSDNWEKLLVSYSIGTSLHEVLFGFIEDQIRKWNKKIKDDK